MKYSSNDLMLTLSKKHECLYSDLHIQVVQVVCKCVSSGFYSSLPLMVLCGAQPGFNVLPDKVKNERKKVENKNSSTTKEKRLIATNNSLKHHHLP